MKVPVHIARALQTLTRGERIPSSQVRHTVVNQMLEDGVLQKILLGAGKSVVVAGNPGALAQYIMNHYGISDLEAYIRLQVDEDATRADAVHVAGNSKVRSIRTFKGFLVQSIGAVQAVLHGEPVIVSPLHGTSWFIQDFEHFLPAGDVTIVGVENGENFQRIRAYGHLFANINPLFVSRYPQSQDLIRWLKKIPNQYLHFGDLDFEGIRIFIQEYHCHLQDRSQFFIPPETERLLQRYGNRALYAKQATTFQNVTLDAALERLIAMFHKYGKVLEQEVFIKEG